MREQDGSAPRDLRMRRLWPGKPGKKRIRRLALQIRGNHIFSGCTILVLMILLFFSCAGKQSASLKEKTLVPVRVVVAGPEAVEQIVSGSGLLEAEKDVLLSSQVGAEVERLVVSVGQEVEEGDTVAVMDGALYRANLKSARAGVLAARGALEKARNDLRRAEKLFENGEISPSEIESVRLEETNAQAAHNSASAVLEKALIDIAHTAIVSPIDGVISEKFCEEGELVPPGAPVASVVGTKRMKVVVGLTSEEVVRVEVGDSSRVYVSSYPDTVFRGAVRFIAPKADDRARTFGVEILVDNSSGELKAGMIARVEITVGILNEAILVPAEAVLEEYGERILFTVEGDQALRKRVKLGRRVGSRMLVLSGVAPGDTIVVVGQQNLRDSSLVKVE